MQRIIPKYQSGYAYLSDEKKPFLEILQATISNNESYELTAEDKLLLKTHLDTLKKIRKVTFDSVKKLIPTSLPTSSSRSSDIRKWSSKKLVATYERPVSATIINVNDALELLEKPEAYLDRIESLLSKAKHTVDEPEELTADESEELKAKILKLNPNLPEFVLAIREIKTAQDYAHASTTPNSFLVSNQPYLKNCHKAIKIKGKLISEQREKALENSNKRDSLAKDVLAVTSVCTLVVVSLIFGGWILGIAAVVIGLAAVITMHAVSQTDSNRLEQMTDTKLPSSISFFQRHKSKLTAASVFTGLFSIVAAPLFLVSGITAALSAGVLVTTAKIAHVLGITFAAIGGVSLLTTIKACLTKIPPTVPLNVVPLNTDPHNPASDDGYSNRNSSGNGPSHDGNRVSTVQRASTALSAAAPGTNGSPAATSPGLPTASGANGSSAPSGLVTSFLANPNGPSVPSTTTHTSAAPSPRSGSTGPSATLFSIKPSSGSTGPSTTTRTSAPAGSGPAGTAPASSKPNSTSAPAGSTARYGRI